MRLPRYVPVLTGAGSVVAVLLAPPVPASAAWAAAADGVASTRAAVLPAASAPVTVATGSSVKVAWPATTLRGGVPVRGYRLTRTNTVTTDIVTVGDDCFGAVSRTACIETGVPDGTWSYRVVAVVGDNWTSAPGVGTPTVVSAKGSVAVTFPAATGVNDAAGWRASACPVPGFCGTAIPAAGRSLTRVEVSLRSGAGWWNPAAGKFNGTKERRFPVSGTAKQWHVPFAFDDFTAGEYALSVHAVDDGGAESVTTLTFTVRTSAPRTVVAPTVTTPATASLTPGPPPTATPVPTPSSSAPTGTVPSATLPTGSASPEPVRSASPEPVRSASPEPVRSASPEPVATASVSPGAL